MKNLLGNSFLSLLKAFNIPTVSCPLPRVIYYIKIITNDYSIIGIQNFIKRNNTAILRSKFKDRSR